MRTFLNRYSEDLQLMADLQGNTDREDLLRMRPLIDRMRGQNMRQAALAIWQEKVKMPAREGRVLRPAATEPAGPPGQSSDP